MNVVVRACYLYPVKSCAGVAIDALTFAESGQIAGDREWMIIDGKGIMTWMGAVPRLTLLQPVRTAGGWALRSPDGDTVPLPPADEGAPCTVQAWNGSRGAFDSLAGRDGGDDLAAFVSQVAGKELRAVWTAALEHRPNPIHLTTGPSLEELSRHLGTSVERMSGHRRFRPNVVLGPAPGEALEPFDEERVKSFTRASLRLEVTERCARCIVVDVDPDAAHTDQRFLVGTKTHSARRHPDDSAAYFGIYARAVTPGRLAVGDTLMAT